jgi:antitoxin MazE
VIVRFRKWGNSVAVRIPRSIAQAIGAAPGKSVRLTIKDGTLVLEPLPKASRKRRSTLEDLLAGMTREDVPPEVDWGPPRGGEVW